MGLDGGSMGAMGRGRWQGRPESAQPAHRATTHTVVYNVYIYYFKHAGTSTKNHARLGDEALRAMCPAGLRPGPGTPSSCPVLMHRHKPILGAIVFLWGLLHVSK